jgi:hypothetical protein
MQLANYDLRMTAGRPRYPIMFRVSGYSHKSYFTLTTVPGLASLTLSPKGSLSYIYPNTSGAKNLVENCERGCPYYRIQEI